MHRKRSIFDTQWVTESDVLRGRVEFFEKCSKYWFNKPLLQNGSWLWLIIANDSYLMIHIWCLRFVSDPTSPSFVHQCKILNCQWFRYNVIDLNNYVFQSSNSISPIIQCWYQVKSGWNQGEIKWKKGEIGVVSGWNQTYNRVEKRLGRNRDKWDEVS